MRPVATASVALTTSHPQPGWAEQDPAAILDSVIETVGQVLGAVGGPERILAAGLDNQGETVVAWSADDGRPLAPAIVWHCRRSLPVVERIRGEGLEDAIRARSGLPLDPYYSASKLTWLLERDPGVRAAARRGTLRLGTVDAWLTAKLDGGDARTDVSTASRTQLFGLRSLTWDSDLLDWFGVAAETLPRIVTTAGDLGRLTHPAWGGSLPLRAMACDQQAALAGHGGFAPGAMKATYGTGVFVLANAGSRRDAAAGLETSIAWTLADGPPGSPDRGSTAAVLQGGVFTAGALLDWLRDDLHLVDDVTATAALAMSVPDAAGVRVLPALAGLGAPWWRPEARGVVAGLSAAAGQAHLVRAGLDGIANRVADVVESMTAVLPDAPTRLRVDGGLTANAYLMQRQADVLGMPVDVAEASESTALGTAALAGLGAGVLDQTAVATVNTIRATYSPVLSSAAREAERVAWRQFVAAAALL